MRLFHFSDKNDIEVFTPRAAATAAPRAADQAGPNEPLVWAVDDWHQPIYMFPHDCPRVFVWPNEATTPQYLGAYKSMTSCRMVAHIELSWLDRLSRSTIYRYELVPDGFEPLGQDGAWVSRAPTMAINVERIDNIEKALETAGVELRVLPSLKTLAPLFNTSLHVSALRLNKALDRKLRLPTPAK